MNLQQAYAVLGLREGATEEEIKKWTGKSIDEAEVD